MNGWAGKVLRVDLGTRKIVKEPINMPWAYDFIGGRGLNSRTLYDEVEPGTDPMGPENVLIVGVGPCNGTLLPGSSSTTISAKSPLSGLLGDSSTRALFGADFRKGQVCARRKGRFEPTTDTRTRPASTISPSTRIDLPSPDTTCTGRTSPTPTITLETFRRPSTRSRPEKSTLPCHCGFISRGSF